MLIGVFKSNQKLVNVVTLLLTIVLWLPVFFIDSKIESFSTITTGFKWLDVIIGILIITGQSIYLNVVVGQYKLIKDNSHLTSLMFVLLNSCFLYLLNLNQIIIANTFIIIAFHQILKLYNVKNSYALMFNASLLIAIATLVYFPNILYFLLLWVALIYNTTPKWRDFVISLIGLSIPILYFATYKFVFSNTLNYSIDNYLINIYNAYWSDFQISSKIFFLILCLIVIMSFVSIFSSLNRSVLRVRKSLIIVVLMAVIGLSTLVLNQFDYIATLLVVSIPFSITVAIFFQELRKKWIAEILFLIFIGSLFFGYFS
jgi:hypothetical protein